MRTRTMIVWGMTGALLAGGMGTASAGLLHWGPGDGDPANPAAGVEKDQEVTVPFLRTTGHQAEYGTDGGRGYLEIGPGENQGLFRASWGVSGGGASLLVEDHTGYDSLFDHIENVDTLTGCNLNPSDDWCDPAVDSQDDSLRVDAEG